MRLRFWGNSEDPDDQLPFKRPERFLAEQQQPVEQS